ncbi:MAG TPA: Wzz/FepE/Etk N-terminal domain-containing protein, partial [Chthoniobacterales bacterium]|nr:Wzz/FepE/Etk N-terminal domain-containing protein [Chthoniobacterales bacterium]
MPELLTDSQPPPPFSPGDILYAIFKHKWKILLGAFAGITAAVVAYNMATPVYESNAKLLVRYVVDRSTIDPEAGAITKMAESALVSECEILTSWDLAMEVVDAIGIDRLIPDGAKTDAAGMVLGGLRVFPSNSMIFVSYVNRNPELSTLILSELLNRYFSKHLEVHRSAGAFDFVTQQTDQVRARLNETEDQLRALKAKAGIVNLGDAYTSLSQTLTKLDEVIHLGEEEIAEQRTRVQMMERAAGQAPAEEGKTERQPPGTPEHQKYQAILGRLHALRQGELDLLARFTPENQYVKLHRAQIRKLEL